ncbi:GRAM domain-containing protein 2B [Etheostoma spectabile]|uniref:GRAM domain-containing protein 2B n=1 Tax=Etheostoma spectabile TaxID=54343 RepID=UPI0013AEE8F8|nr:GRAM domain-containing protein 2B-like [Etheostoma spectabile]
MCMSWKYFFSTMNAKCRRFSLDSSVCLDGVGLLTARRGSSRFGSKESKKSLDEARQEVQKFSPNSSTALRETSIAERSDGPVSNNSFLKHKKTFHKLFQEIPEGETLTHTFTCALQKEVLYHGKLFVCENYVCFHSSVLLKDTKVVIPVSSITGVKKQHSALSMMSIQTADREKYSFVSLRNREVCYRLIQAACSHAQEESVNGSPHVSSAENEVDHDVASSYSSLEDSVDLSVPLDNGFPQMSSEGPSGCSSTRQNSLTDEDDRGESVRWIWRITEMVFPLSFLREILSLRVLVFVYMMLVVLLLLGSGYIGLRILALEEQLTEWSLRYREYQQT